MAQFRDRYNVFRGSLKTTEYTYNGEGSSSRGCRDSVLPSMTYKEKWFLIDFYKQQYRYLLKVGIGNVTRSGNVVSRKLITSTENRLDQIFRGRKTAKNTSAIEGYCKNYWYNSNRSFKTENYSEFQIHDLEITQQHAVVDAIDYADGIQDNHPMYIDRVTTAYNSEIMRAVLSHDN